MPNPEKLHIYDTVSIFYIYLSICFIAILSSNRGDAMANRQTF